MQSNITSKKMILTLALVLTVTIAGVYLIGLIGRKNITISAPEGAEIFVATEPNAEFERIGTTKATYSTKEDGALYFEVSQGANVSRVSVLSEQANGTTIDVPLGEVKQPEKLIDGPIKDPLVSQGYIYGISGVNNSFISASLSEFSPPELKYIGLPYLDSIAWQNPNNFAYESFDGRVGQFINGKDEGSSNLVSGIDGDELTGNFSDMSKFQDKPIVFLGVGRIYTGSGIGKNVKPLANVDFGGENFLSSDGYYIYHSTTTPPAAFASEATNGSASDSDAGDEHSLKLSVLDYSGRVVAELALPDVHSISDVSSLGDGKFLVLTGEGLVVAESGVESSLSPYYLGSANNMVSVNGDIYLIDTDGIWNYNPSTGISQLVSPFVGTQVYVLGSATAESAGSILYSTTGDDLSGSTTSGAVYRLTP